MRILYGFKIENANRSGDRRTGNKRRNSTLYLWSHKEANTSKAKLVNFRLSEAFDDILEAEAIRTGQSRTTVLKAALAAFDNLDENQKNHWLLESAKF